MEVQPTLKEINRPIIADAIAEYLKEFKRPGYPPLIRPGLNSSTVENDRVYLRTGKHLLAIFRTDTRKFLPLTPSIIHNHSK